jgi:hypothetical protein
MVELIREVRPLRAESDHAALIAEQIALIAVRAGRAPGPAIRRRR